MRYHIFSSSFSVSFHCFFLGNHAFELGLSFTKKFWVHFYQYSIRCSSGISVSEDVTGMLYCGRKTHRPCGSRTVNLVHVEPRNIASPKLFGDSLFDVPHSPTVNDWIKAWIDEHCGSPEFVAKHQIKCHNLHENAIIIS